MSKDTTNEIDNTDLLNDFKWDSNSDFFGIESETETKVETETKKEVETETEEQKKEEKETDKSKAEEGDKEEFFDHDKQVDSGNEDDDDETEVFTTLSKELKEKGTFTHIELSADGKITEEQFFEHIEDEVEGRVNEAIEDFGAKLGSDQTSKAYITFLKAGGTSDEFFKYYSQASTTPEVDIEKESGQDSILRHYYKVVEELDDEDLEDKLDWLKESGKKKKFAEKYYNKLKADEQINKDKFVANQVQQQTDRENEKKEFVTKLKNTLDSTEEVNGFVFNKVDKPSLLDYIIKPTVKLKSNQYITQFQYDLNEVIKTDNEKLLVLAKLIKSKFDTSGLIIKKETEAVKKVKSSLSNTKSRLTSSNSTKRKDLADFFN